MDVLAIESDQRNVYDLVDELGDFISTPDLLIIKSNIKAGEMSKGFDFVGDRKIRRLLHDDRKVIPPHADSGLFFRRRTDCRHHVSIIRIAHRVCRQSMSTAQVHIPVKPATHSAGILPLVPRNLPAFPIYSCHHFR